MGCGAWPGRREHAPLRRLLVVVAAEVGARRENAAEGVWARIPLLIGMMLVLEKVELGGWLVVVGVERRMERLLPVLILVASPVDPQALKAPYILLHQCELHQFTFGRQASQTALTPSVLSAWWGRRGGGGTSCGGGQTAVTGWR